MSVSNITPKAGQQDSSLAALAETIRDAHSAVGHAARNMLSHAMAAGDALDKAKAKVGSGGWGRFLKKECDLADRTAQRYMQLAAARTQFEQDPSRATHLSITGALRLLGNRPRKHPAKAAKQPAPALSSLAWSEASPEVRRRFLDAIGVTSLLAALPDPMRLEIKRQLMVKPKREKPADQPVGDGLDVPEILRRPPPARQAFDFQLPATEVAA
jgi:DUF3102 family protein